MELKVGDCIMLATLFKDVQCMSVSQDRTDLWHSTM